MTNNTDSVAVNIIKKIILEIAGPKYGKSKFLKKINRRGNLLDVGCGNNSPYKIKTKCPKIHYTGIDIGDYNQNKPNLADSYITAKPENFAETIENLPELFDTVISSHNLEHCNNREKALNAMIKVLKSGGYLYLSFPTEASVNFPGYRNGCLNYYDDPTHKYLPPDFFETINTLKENNMEIIFSSRSYKPVPLCMIGFFLEWKSKKDKETKLGTWAYWGFETIIWAKKK
ncbi:MAG: class I SAM-dependent methyltransferase [Treponema sp.]|nr:class I SAM-dependent methyltransferase [Treponema sp.]